MAGGPSLGNRARAVARAARGIPRNLPVPNPLERRTLDRAVRGKYVLITGASSGIGRALALQVADAGAEVLLVARTREKLEAVQAEIRDAGGNAHVHPCDLTDSAEIVQMTAAERRSGHIVNVSSMGVQVNTPRFSAYVASKAALDSVSRCIGSEIVDDDVAITTVYMPLVRTPMIEPTSFYRGMPALEPEEAADMIAKAIANRPKRATTAAGRVAELTYATAPKVPDAVVNAAFKLVPGSSSRRR